MLFGKADFSPTAVSTASSRSAARCAVSEKVAAILCRPSERSEAAHVEFDFSGQFDDGFGMVAVFEQCVFDGLRTADEQAAIKTALFLGDPLAASVPADKNDG